MLTEIIFCSIIQKVWLEAKSKIKKKKRQILKKRIYYQVARSNNRIALIPTNYINHMDNYDNY